MLNTAIIGAGPYGLSVAAHLRHFDIPFRIFGRPMDSWRSHMPKGMLLKSDGFASNLSDPEGRLTLAKFCRERGIEYGDTVIPVRLDTFTEYGLTFANRMVPELEDRMVVGIARSGEGYEIQIEDGERFTARNVVLAVGITHFEHVPENLAHLPEEFFAHSARHREVEPFRGRSVVVLGGGASALDWAALLYEAGADVQLVARTTTLKFHGKPTRQERSLWERIQRPQTGLGPGWKSKFYANAPAAFYHLPENLRLEIVRRSLGPSGGWFVKDRIMNDVQRLLGYSPERAEIKDRKVHLHLRAQDGQQREITTDYVIAATGYKVKIERLQFLSQDIRSQLKAVENTPVLSSTCESSMPGLYFVGIAAANSFGPVMRFAFGSDFAARTVARALAKSSSLEPAEVAVEEVLAASK